MNMKNFQTETVPENNDFEISEIYSYLKKKIVVILLVSTIVMVCSFAVSKIILTKKYSSNFTMIVNNRKSESNAITNDEINSAKNLTSVYAIILKSDPIIESVIQNLELNESKRELSNMISISSVDATQIMNISVVTEDGEKSFLIANEIMKIAPEIIVDIAEAGTVKIISNPELKLKPVSPNVLKNSIFGFLVGALSSMAYVVVSEFKNRKIKSELDVEKFIDLPLLGIIPNVDSVRKIGHSSNSKRGK